MRVNSLPQPVLAKLLTLDDYARVCEEVAKQAESELARTRDILNGNFAKTGFMREDQKTVQQAQARFEAVYQRSLAAPKRATAARANASKAKAFVTAVPEGTQFELIEPVVGDGVDFAQVETRVLSLRGEIAKIKSAPLPATDIRQRCVDHVAGLARAARPMIRGIAQGERLEIQWPCYAGADRKTGTGFSPTEGNVVLMAAIFQDDAMVDYLTSEITAMTDGVMPPKERPAKLSQLAAELEQWERLAVLLTDQRIAAGEEAVHDSQSGPEILLGVAIVNPAARDERTLAS